MSERYKSNQFPVKKKEIWNYKVIDKKLNVYVSNSPYPVCRNFIKNRPDKKLFKIVKDKIIGYK